MVDSDFAILQWKFEDAATIPKIGLVLIYDFENFTQFLTVPDIQHSVPAYLNHVDQQVRLIFEGGAPLYEWEDPPRGPEHFPPLNLPLLHRKFLGDGAMFIFDATDLPKDQREDILGEACLRAWNTKKFFENINRAAEIFMPVGDLPERIRFGITYGTIYELRRSDGQAEYLGFAINLAARLQKYAGTASFLASARLPIRHHWFVEYDFVKAKAKQLRNGNEEFVYIDKDDLKRLQRDSHGLTLFEVLK